MAKVGTIAMSAGVGRNDLKDSSHHQFNAKKMKKKLDIFDTAFVGDNGGFQVVVQDDDDFQEETASVTATTKDTSKLHESNESLFMDDSCLDFNNNNTQAANNNIKKKKEKKNHYQSDSSPPPPSSRSSSANPHAGTLEALLSSDKDKVATRTKSVCGDENNNDDKNTLFGRVFMRKKKKNLNELIPRREDLDNNDDDRSVGTAPLIPDTTVTPIKKQAPAATTPVKKTPLAPFNPYGNNGRDWTSFDDGNGFFTGDMMTVPDIEASQRTTTTALSHGTSSTTRGEEQQDNFESSQRSSSTNKSRKKNNNKNSSSFDVGLETPKSPSLSGTPGGKKKMKIRRSDLYGPSSRQSSGRNLLILNVEKDDDNDDDSTKRKKKLKKKQGSQRKLKDVEADVSDTISNKKSLKKKQNSQRKLAVAAAAATESGSLLSTDSNHSIPMDEEFRSPRRGTRKKLMSQASKQKLLQHESDNLSSLSRGGSDHNKGRPQSRGRSRESTMMPPGKDSSLELDAVKIDDDEFNFTETSTSIRQGKSLHQSATAPTSSSSSSNVSILAPLLPPPPDLAVGRRRSRSACAEKRFSETTTNAEAAQRAASPILGRHRKVVMSASPRPRRAVSLMAGPPPNDSPVRVASKTAASPKPRRNTQSMLVLSKSQALVLSTGRDLSSPKPVSSRHQSPKFASPKIWKKPPPVRGRSRSPGPGCHRSKSPKRPLRSRSAGGGLVTAESVASARARSASPRRSQQYQSESNTATSASPKPGRRRGVRTGPPQKSRSFQLSLSDHNTSPSAAAAGGGTIAGRRRSRSSRHLLVDSNTEPSPKAGGVLNQTTHTVMSMPTEMPNLSPGRGKQSSSNSCNGTMTNYNQTIVSPKSGRRKAIKSIPRKQRSLREMGATSEHSSSDTTTATPSPGTPTGGRRRARISRNLLNDNPGSLSPKRNDDKPPTRRFRTLSKASMQK